MTEENEINIKAGFLLVKTYATIWSEYSKKYDLKKDFYGFPRIDRNPSEQRIQYRGLDRDALDAYKDSDNLAEIQMEELEKSGKCDDGFLFDLTIAREIQELLKEKITEYEIIWTRIEGIDIAPPDGFKSIGFEPSFFVGDHFSASSDCMIIPRWHGTDDEGTLFSKYFDKLNRYGLFESPEEAKSFLDYYLSFDWTETGEYEIAEVFIALDTQIHSGKQLVLDKNAEPSSLKLPAFLAKPEGAPVYHGFPLLKESETDGWILGIITEYEDENGCDEGDAYVQAPNGDRIGLVWDVGNDEISTISEPDEKRMGVFQVWFPKTVKTKEDMIENFRHVLPSVRNMYEELKKGKK
ncbi:MAG: hypothetical protein JW863_11200 [Chitinispirillaceae bacterium]|nr:hypothetical protein [Chitinispirillaceae bacterium]